MTSNTWYTVARTTDSECIGRVSFSIGSSALVFDVLVQYGNISISIVSAVVVPDTVFSMRVRTSGPYRYVDIRTSVTDGSTPSFSVSQVLNTLSVTSFEAAGTGTQDCIISTDAWAPGSPADEYVTIGNIETITALKYFTDGVAIGDRDRYHTLVYGNDGIYLGGYRVLTTSDSAGYVTTGSYNSTTKKIELKHGSTVLAEIDATDFIKDGMVDSVTVEDGYLVITFNADSGKEPISVELSDFFDADDYYDKSDIDTLLAGYLPLTGGTITGNLKVNGVTELVSALIIPASAPSSPVSGKTYIYAGSGSYGEEPSGGVGEVYKLILKKGATTLGTYEPDGGEDQTIDIANAFNGYATQTWVTTQIGNIDLTGYVPTTRKVNGKALSSDITLGLSDVATKSDIKTMLGNDSYVAYVAGPFTAWGQTYWNNGAPQSISGSLTSVTDITGSGKITIPKGKFASLLMIPSSAPSSGDVVSGETYIYSGTGSYGEEASGGISDVSTLTITINGSSTVYDPAGDDASVSFGSASQKAYTGTIESNGTGLPTAGAVYTYVNNSILAAQPYKGVSSTAITDGGTEMPTITGYTTRTHGDVVAYDKKEFIWDTNDKWRLLGDEGSYALKTTSVIAGTGLSGGGQISQDVTLNLSSATITSLGKADTAYQKPSGGIPDSDLADAYLKLSGNSVATKITGDVYMTRGKYLKMVESNGTDSVNLLGISSSGAWFTLGNSSYRAEISSNNSNILHVKNGVSYAVYDESNLTKSVLTTLLESSNGYYVKKAGDTMTGDLTFDASSANRAITWKDSSSNTHYAMLMYSSGVFAVGYNQIARGKYTLVEGSDIHLQWNTTADTKQAVLSGSDFRPKNGTNDLRLGHPSYYWSALYASGAKIPTFLAIPQSAPSTSASWYSANDAYLYADTSGNYSESAGGGVANVYPLTITINGTSTVYNPGSAAQTVSFGVPTSAQISAWNAKYDKPSGGIPGTDLATAYLPLTGGTITSTGVKPLILNSTHSSSQSSLRLSISGTEKAVFGYQESYNVGAYLQNLAVTNYPYVNIASDGKFKYNNSWVFWHEGNDGASSGLDADLLDGNEGSYYDSLYAFYDSGSTSALGVQYPLALLKTSTPNASYWWYIRSMYYSSANQCFQEAFTYNQTTPDMYIRQTYGGTTTNWYKVYHTGNLAKSDLTALLDASTGTYVPKKQNTNFYPYIGTGKGSKWYKVTFPHNGQAAGANRWFMLGMDLVISSVYYTSPIRGVVHLMYYFSYSNSTSTYTAGNVKGMFTGVNYTGVQVKYDASNPAIFYVRTVNDSTASTTLSIENLMAMDSAVNWDYLNTTIEAIAEASIPSSASTVVPIDSYLPLTAGSSYPLTGVLYSDLTSSNTARFAMKVNGTERASIGFSSGYMSLVSNGEELCVSGGDDQRIYVNYRKAHDGYAPASWYLMAGTNTSYASLYAGVVRPGLDNSYTLGGPSNRWSAIYGMTGYLYGNLFFDATSANRGISWTNSSNVTASALAMNSNGALVLGANQITNSKDTYVYGTHIYLTWGSSRQLQFTDNTVVPNSTKVISLGTDSLRYRYIYGQAIEADTFNGLFYTSSENATAFTRRATPSTAVGDSLLVKKVKGKTIVWNQYEPNATFADGTTRYSSYGSATISASGGKLSVNVTSAYGGFITPSFALTSGHKYLLRMVVNCPASTALLIYHSGNSFIPGTTLAAGLNVFTGTATAPNSVTGGLILRFSVVQTYTVTSVLFFDLTQMGLESIDTDKFNSLFPLNYYAYNTGSLLSLTGTGIETNGFNQWDEEMEDGTFDWTTGAKVNGSAYLRTKNPIPVFPNTTYFLKSPLAVPIWEYDAEGNFYGDSPTVNANSTFTTPAYCHYINFRFAKSNYGSSTYQHDICINLSDTSRNGTYEPYKKNIAELGITTLKVKSPNIWDEQWELGTYSSTGAKENDGGAWVRCKTPIPVSPNTIYYGKNGASAGNICIQFLDSEKNLIYGVSGYDANNRIYVYNATFTTPSNARYIQFFIQTAYGSTYNNNITINKSDPAFNGKYFSHEPLAPFSDGLAGVGSVYDELTGIKAVKRLGIVDLGTLNWTYDSGQRFAVQKPDAAHSLTGSPCMCARYVGYTGVWSGFSDKQVVVGHNTYSGSSYIVIKDSAYTDAAVFKTAMNGVYLVYELAYPEEYEPLAPFAPFALSDKLGTQTLVPENNEYPYTAPLVADIQYGSNLGDTPSAIDWKIGNIKQSNLFGNDAIGSTAKPVYYDGTSIVACGTSLTDYLPLTGGTMTGANPINFTSAKLAMEFRPEHSSYYTRLMYSTYGNEALVLTAKNSSTSLIFNCGKEISSTDTWASVFTASAPPTMQLKNKSVYINSFISNGTNPSYNLYVGGISYLPQLDVPTSLSVPTAAPSSPGANKVYMWIGSTGTYVN